MSYLSCKNNNQIRVDTNMLHENKDYIPDNVTSISNGDDSISTLCSDVYDIPPIEPDGLSWPGIGTRSRINESPEQEAARLEKMKAAISTVIECLGEDPSRNGIIKSPERYAKAMLFFTKGYQESLYDILNSAVFEESHEDSVLVKDIVTFSLCEHHLVPFKNNIAIAYIPNRNVIGLSKLARISEMYSQRLQVQERLTKQIAIAIDHLLQPRGVAVMIESSHQCMSMRGVQKPDSKTITSFTIGKYKECRDTRREFFDLVGRK
ncbi:GTP cyclohydrolase 1 [Smittium culicis]|uniref:GTP cyclohydrolase 1 n=2 Tax=Smittium culicis TaxID=133412 RepID=A0A1R1YM58_9FUNG|nr:GTP cyclohydrolase 1 [Smittium culicis]